MNLQRVKVCTPARRARGARQFARCSGSVAVVLVFACALLCLISLETRAQQQPGRTAVEIENAELRKRIQSLEERLEKLEAQQGVKQAVKSSDDAADATAPGVVAAAPSPSPSIGKQTKESRLLNFFKTTDVSGFIDTYYSYNFNRPAGRTNQARSFDSRHNQFAFNVAEIAFEREPTEESRFGFRVDLSFGAGADYLSAAEPGGVEVYKHLRQAYGSYLAPVGRGLRFDVGKFGAWVGAEEDEAKDNWNYSRGLLYAFAQPAYHMGVSAAYPFSKKVKLMGAVFNGWNNVEENNDAKSYGFLLSLTPTSKLSVEQSYLYGAEQPDDSRPKRHLFDTVVFYDIDERFSVSGNYDYGFDRLTDGSRVRWQGVAAAMRYAASKRVAFSPRFEWYKDYDGFTTGTAQRLKELTLTGEYKFSDNLLTRVEYRRDWSDQAFFQTSDPNLFTRHQTTMVGGLIFSFSTKDPDAPESPDEAPNNDPPKPPASSVSSQSAASVHASGIRPDRPRRAVAAAPAGQQHAALSRDDARASLLPTQTKEARPDTRRDSSATQVFKITDRLPPPSGRKLSSATRP